MAGVDAHDLVRASDPTRGRSATTKIGACHAARFLEAVTGDSPFLPTLSYAAIAELDRPVSKKVKAECQAVGPPDVPFRVDGDQRDMAQLRHESILADSGEISRRHRESISGKAPFWMGGA